MCSWSTQATPAPGVPSLRDSAGHTRTGGEHEAEVAAALGELRPETVDGQPATTCRRPTRSIRRSVFGAGRVAIAAAGRAGRCRATPERPGRRRRRPSRARAGRRVPREASVAGVAIASVATVAAIARRRRRVAGPRDRGGGPGRAAASCAGTSRASPASTWSSRGRGGDRGGGGELLGSGRAGPAVLTLATIGDELPTLPRVTGAGHRRDGTWGVYASGSGPVTGSRMDRDSGPPGCATPAPPTSSASSSTAEFATAELATARQPPASRSARITFPASDAAPTCAASCDQSPAARRPLAAPMCAA
jgi:hypothetical protein